VLEKQKHEDLEGNTMQHRLMTEDEKVAIATEAMRLRREGKVEEASALNRSIPMQPYLAKYWRDVMGLDFLVESGWNLAEAEAEYGPGWISQ
jgi:hypothetical protein